MWLLLYPTPVEVWREIERKSKSEGEKEKGLRTLRAVVVGMVAGNCSVREFSEDSDA